jgi:hypothetical protein
MGIVGGSEKTDFDHHIQREPPTIRRTGTTTDHLTRVIFIARPDCSGPAAGPPRGGNIQSSRPARRCEFRVHCGHFPDVGPVPSKEGVIEC